MAEDLYDKVRKTSPILLTQASARKLSSHRLFTPVSPLCISQSCVLTVAPGSWNAEEVAAGGICPVAETRKPDFRLWLQTGIQSPKIGFCFTPKSRRSRGRHRLPVVTHLRHWQSNAAGAGPHLINGSKGARDNDSVILRDRLWTL